MKEPYRYACLLLLSVLLLVSCSPFEPVAIPDAAGEIPETYTLYTGLGDTSTPWWTTLDAPELDRLIQEAISGNFSMNVAWARLRQAGSIAIQVGAARYPDLTANGTAEIFRNKTESTAGVSVEEQNYAIGLVSSYEVDLWGRIRSQREAALLDVDASRADVYTAMVTVAAEVADRWVRIIAQRLQLQLLEKQLANNQTFLELIELRFRKAMVSALDVYQQRQTVESVRARIPLADAELQLLTHELAVLLGRLPRSDLDLSQLEMPEIGQLPPVGLPADLLASRPDVQAAGMRLTSAQWQVAAARANRLPALRLTARAEYGRGELDLLLDTWFLSLAANLTAPIFDGGRRAAEVDRTRANVDESLWIYRQAVVSAIKEVEDAMVSETRQREHIQGLEAVKAASSRGLEEAIGRYRSGLSDYLPVLTQLLAVQDLERNLINQRALLIRYRVGLYRALGGGWTSEAIPLAHNPTTGALARAGATPLK
jgi:NodT family efflux transporter outer membrane factor (OMF) lipoprotein